MGAGGDWATFWTLTPWETRVFIRARFDFGKNTILAAVGAIFSGKSEDNDLEAPTPELDAAADEWIAGLNAAARAGQEADDGD